MLIIETPNKLEIYTCKVCDHSFIYSFESNECITNDSIHTFIEHVLNCLKS